MGCSSFHLWEWCEIYGQLFQYGGCWNQCDLSVLSLIPSNFLDMKSYPVYRECIIYRMNRNLSAIYLTIFFQRRRGATSLPNNYPSSPNGLWVNEGERNNCFSKIQLVGKKYRDEKTLASKTRFSRHCFGFQIRRFSLLVGYNIYPGSSSTNQNTALIMDH